MNIHNDNYQNNCTVIFFFNMIHYISAWSIHDDSND